jgi:hypothetical protein
MPLSTFWRRTASVTPAEEPVPPTASVTMAVTGSSGASPARVRRVPSPFFELFPPVKSVPTAAQSTAPPLVAGSIRKRISLASRPMAAWASTSDTGT